VNGKHSFRFLTLFQVLTNAGCRLRGIQEGTTKLAKEHLIYSRELLVPDY